MRAPARSPAIVAVAVALAVAGCGGGKAKPKAPAQPFDLSVQTGGPNPRVGKDWPVTLTVTRAGRPLSGKVTYEFVFGGSVVGKRGPYPLRGGHYHDTPTFPTRAIGIPLTFRLVVSTRYGTRNVDRQVTVRR